MENTASSSVDPLLCPAVDEQMAGAKTSNVLIFFGTTDTWAKFIRYYSWLDRTPYSNGINRGRLDDEAESGTHSR